MSTARGRDAVLLYLAIRAAGLVALAVAATIADRDVLRILTGWDGQWYAGIAENGYGYVRHHPDGRLLYDYAFFPLLPALEAALHDLTGVAPAVGGFLASCCAAPVAALGVYRVVNLVCAASVALITVVLWGSVPVASVQTLAYTESLFTALAAWALYCCLRAKWLLAAALAAAAALTRPTGVAVTAAVLVGAALAVRRPMASDPSARTPGRVHGRVHGHVHCRVHGRVADSGAAVVGPLVCAAVCLASTLAYPAWVGWRVGAIDGYFDVTSGWENNLDFGRAFATWVLTHPFPVAALLVLAVAVVVALLVGCVRLRLPAPLLVYATVVVAMSFATSGYFGSKPRYLLPAFVLLIPVAVWVQRQHAAARVTCLGVLAVGSVAYGVWWLLGSGPP